MAVIKAVEVRVLSSTKSVEVGGGIPGSPGTDGTDGADGISVTGAELDVSGHLILSFSSGPDVDVGKVTGNDGVDGADGTNGANGVSIVGATVDGSYHLILDLSTGPNIDAGYVRGPAGADGADGADGLMTSVVAGTGISIDNTDPANPVISATGGGGGGSGDVVGPAGAVNDRFASFDGTTGKLIQDSGYSAASFATLASPAFTGTPTSTTAPGTDNSTRIATTAQVQAALAAYIAAQDVLVFKGVIDCSTNPNYPAADAGHVYKVSVAGKIGGASGPNVEVGDVLTCLADSTASGTHAAVGANWVISQVNIDGAVTGPTSVTDGNLAAFNGTTGKLIKQLTPAQVRSALSLVIGTNVQAWDADLDAIAALAASNDDFIQRKSGAWSNRTPTQVTADLLAMIGDSGSGGTKGLVPAPAAGDAAAGKVLKADGTWIVPSSVPAGAIMDFALANPPTGWLAADGAAVLVASYSVLAAAIYCGDSNNATAAWGYRATTNVNPSANRSISGAYIVLPDFRGEFRRGWDNGRGKDSGRSLYSAQTDALKSHTHSGSADNGGNHTHSGSTSSDGSHSHNYSATSTTSNTNTTATGSSERVVTSTEFVASTVAAGAHTHTVSIPSGGSHSHTLSINNTGDTETRPTNVAALVCIKY